MSARCLQSFHLTKGRTLDAAGEALVDGSHRCGQAIVREASVAPEAYRQATPASAPLPRDGVSEAAALFASSFFAASAVTTARQSSQ